jgi:hypothetical protein
MAAYNQIAETLPVLKIPEYLLAQTVQSFDSVGMQPLAVRWQSLGAPRLIDKPIAQHMLHTIPKPGLMLLNIYYRILPSVPGM